MSSHNHARLAGLDAMVLHFSHSNSSVHQSTALDGIPYVTISRTIKSHGSTRTSRTPLSDKTPDFNTTHSSTSANLCKHALSPLQEIPKERRHASVSRPKPCRASTSFHPLPPVPSSSTLQLPSFSNYNFYTSTPPPKPNTSTPPSVLLPLEHVDIALPFPSPQETLDADEDEYHIPAFQHPNSPYVPWAPPVRREILCPPTPVSDASSEYTRSYSRSGARAPEPVDLSVFDDPYTAPKISKSWRTLGQALKKNAKHVARRITNPFKAVASHISTSVPSGSRERKRNVLRKQISRPCQTEKEIRKSTSIASFDSRETTTLATWLAVRRRISLERDYDPQSMMSLEEYERTGSWIKASESEIDSSCGVPECRMHSQPSNSNTCPHPPPWHEKVGEGVAHDSPGREMNMPGGWIT